MYVVSASLCCMELDHDFYTNAAFADLFSLATMNHGGYLSVIVTATLTRTT
jgi:hypothetical protein